jgi:hypothetical protein
MLSEIGAKTFDLALKPEDIVFSRYQSNTGYLGTGGIISG